MKFFITSLLIASTVLASSCAVHKIDMQQGNVITQEMLQTLSVGMEKKQVRHLLGSPMVEDPFHANRWDYVYRFVDGRNGDTQNGHLMLGFTGDKLDSINVIQQLPKDSEIRTPRLQD